MSKHNLSYIAEDLSTTKLSKCSMELDGILNEVEAGIEGVSSKLSRVWMKGNASFLPDVIVEGKYTFSCFIFCLCYKVLYNYKFVNYNN